MRDYPGNVRELKAKVRELVVTSHGDLGRMISLALNGDSVTKCEQLKRILELTN